MKYANYVLKHNGLSWFYNRYELIYLGIPKTASTSMRHFLSPNGQCMFFDLNENLNENLRKHKIFTVIRNPYDRFISGVFESLKRDESNHIKNLRNLNNIELLFTKIINIIEKEGFVDVHITPQHFFFHNKVNEPFNFDYVMSFEDLHKDFKNMCEELEIKSNLPHKQVGRTDLKNKSKLIIDNNKFLKNKIEEIYENDFILYEKYKK